MNQDNTNINHETAYSGSILNGFLMAAITFILMPLVIVLLFAYLESLPETPTILVASVLIVLTAISMVGFFTQEPNESRVMIFFGRYRGTFRKTGFYWINPLMRRRKLSLRIRNMDIEPIKVNDKIGNPVMIGMVLVWRIKDTYRAIFDVDTPSGANGTAGNVDASLCNFVRIQSDAALREVTGLYAYDEDGSEKQELTLRDGGNEINELLESKINERLHMAGMEVVEARLNYLAYAPEIAAVMLRRQQASAIIAAREKIVEGAVSMVEMALKRIDEKDITQFDERSKAQIVSNLLVVLCGDEPAQPVVNTSN